MRTIWKSAALSAVFVGFIVGSASAQQTIIANVPFAFEVGHQQVPAGRYEAVLDGDILMLRGENVHAAAYAVTSPASGHDPDGAEPALVFSRGEDGYHLSAIWEAGGTEGRALPVLSGVSRDRHGKAELAEPGGPAVVIRADANQG
jgi:hypothetical protein